METLAINEIAKKLLLDGDPQDKIKKSIYDYCMANIVFSILSRSKLDLIEKDLFNIVSQIIQKYSLVISFRVNVSREFVSSEIKIKIVFKDTFDNIMMTF